MRTLFLGAHPDDVEIGAGGALARLVMQGEDVHLIVLTDETDPDITTARRRETIASLGTIGLLPNRIGFLGEMDGNLAANDTSVTRLRHLLQKMDVEPDLVFVHSKSDSHNDHRASYALAQAAFRKTIILSYAVVNSGSISEFAPEIFVDITKFRNSKIMMLKAYQSQEKLARIRWLDIEEADRRFASMIEGSFCEPFEINIQQGASDKIKYVEMLNDCSFTRFWGSICQVRNLHILTGQNTDKIRPDQADTILKDVEAVYSLERQFDRFLRYAGSSRDRIAVHRHFSSGYGDEEIFRLGNVLLVGGSVSNIATGRIFNFCPRVRYTIEYSMPDYQDIRIRDGLRRRSLRAAYRVEDNGKKTVVRDIGILSIIRNPYNEHSWILGAMGVHGYATSAVVSIFACKSNFPDITNYLPLIARPELKGFQILVEVKDGERSAKFNPRTIHEIY